MGKKDELFIEAERLYVRKLKSIPEIAAILPVSQTSLYKWSKEGGWEDKREKYLASEKGSLEQAEKLLVRILTQLSEKPVDQLGSKDIDKLSKISKTVESLRKKHDPYDVAVSFFEDFVPWLLSSVQDEALRKTVFEVTNKYVEYVRNREA